MQNNKKERIKTQQEMQWSLEPSNIFHLPMAALPQIWTLYVFGLFLATWSWYDLKASLRFCRTKDCARSSSSHGFHSSSPPFPLSGNTYILLNKSNVVYMRSYMYMLLLHARYIILFVYYNKSIWLCWLWFTILPKITVPFFTTRWTREITLLLKNTLYAAYSENIA